MASPIAAVVPGKPRFIDDRRDPGRHGGHITARIVRHGRYVTFQLTEVTVPRALFAAVLRRMDRFRPRPLLM